MFIERSIAKQIQWDEVFKGFVPTFLPNDRRGVTLIIATFSATVGISKTFLFGYSYLKKGWGKYHTGLASFDMITGILIPFPIDTALMIIAPGASKYDHVKFADGNIRLSPIETAYLLQEAGISLIISRVIFGLGIVFMAFKAIILHMIVCEFTASEIFNIKPGTIKEKLATLIPIPGILGVIIWEDIGLWMAMPTGAYTQCLYALLN